MDNDNKEKIESGYEIESEVSEVLLPAVTEKYTYYAIKSLYGQINFKDKTDDIRKGVSFGAPAGYTVMVAFVRQGKEKVEEELKEGAITFDEFVMHWNATTQLMKTARDTYKSEGF